MQAVNSWMGHFRHASEYAAPFEASENRAAHDGGV